MIPISHDMIIKAFKLLKYEIIDAIYRINDVGYVMTVLFLFFNLGYLILMTIQINEVIQKTKKKKKKWKDKKNQEKLKIITQVNGADEDEKGLQN